MNRRVVYGGCCCALIALVTVGTMYEWPESAVHANQPAPPEQSEEPAPLTHMDQVSVLLRLGFTPEALVVGACDSDDVATLRAELVSQVAAARELQELDTTVTDLIKSLGDARSEIRRFGLTDALAEHRSILESGLATSRASYASAEAELRTDLTSSLVSSIGADNARMLHAFVANADRKVRKSFRVLSLTEAEWAALERAEANQDRDAENPLTVDEAAVAAVAETSGDVTSAALRLLDEQAVADLGSYFHSPVIESN